MKTLIALILLTVSAAQANVVGTLVQKGDPKGVAFVNGVEVKCQMDIDKDDIKNSLTEDAAGNPAYKVLTNIKLNSTDSKLLELKFKQTLIFTNLHPTGVNDSLYSTKPTTPTGTVANFTIDNTGVVKTLTVVVNGANVNCAF